MAGASVGRSISREDYLFNLSVSHANAREDGRLGYRANKLQADRNVIQRMQEANIRQGAGPVGSGPLPSSTWLPPGARRNSSNYTPMSAAEAGPYSPKGNMSSGYMGGELPSGAVGAPRRAAPTVRGSSISSEFDSVRSSVREGLGGLSRSMDDSIGASRARIHAMADPARNAASASIAGGGASAASRATGLRGPAGSGNSISMPLRQSESFGTSKFTSFTKKTGGSAMSDLAGKAGLNRPMTEGVMNKIMSGGSSLWQKTNFTHALGSKPGMIGAGAMAAGLAVGAMGNMLAPNLVTTDEHFVRNAIGMGAAAGALAVLPKAVLGAAKINPNIPKWAVNGASSLTKNWTKGRGMMLAMGAAGVMGGLETHFTQALNGNN